MKKPTTIYEIAKHIQVSPSTVSRALNGDKLISEKTTKRIINAAAELNYNPNLAAKYLKKKTTNQILLSLPHLMDEFYFEMIAAVQTTVKSEGYSLLLNYTEDNEEDELRSIKELCNNYIDGIILVTLNINEKHIREMKKIEKPIVLSNICKNRVSDYDCKCDYVGVDTKKGIYMSTKHLIEKGHKKIAFIGHDKSILTGKERFAGFSQAMNECGIDIQERYVLTGKYTASFGYEVGLQIVKMVDRPTAICASADMMVVGLYRAFSENNVSIPGDISVMGMDNIGLTTLVKPKISTVALHQADIGRTAANMIIDRLKGNLDPFKSIVFEPELILRESD